VTLIDADHCAGWFAYEHSGHVILHLCLDEDDPKELSRDPEWLHRGLEDTGLVEKLTCGHISSGHGCLLQPHWPQM
jgi:hypothetical protein